MEKFLSVEDVNSRIPEVMKIFERIAELNQQSLAVSKDIHSLFEIWGEQVRAEGNLDHGLYQERLARREQVKKEMHLEIQRIEGVGGLVKDLQNGLVDFYLERGGEGVYLCWKAGEDKIRHWHPLQAGFAARRPLKELFEASYI